MAARRSTVCFAVLAALAFAAPAHAAFPGANGKIAFSYGGEIRVINPDGTGDTQLTNNGAVDDNPAWSPNGKKILFSSNRTGSRAIWVMNADGSGQTQVTFPSVGDDSNPSWSPDGTKISFDRTFPYNYGGNTNECRTRLYVANADGSGETDISPTTSTNCFYDPDWSPDGGLIAFVSTLSGMSGNLDEDVWTIKPDGTGATRLSHHPFSPYPDCFDSAGPSWSPDGTKIDCNADNFRLISINRDGTGQQVVGEPGSISAVWSPDGQRVAYLNVDLSELRVANSSFSNPVSIRSGGQPGSWQPLTGYAHPRGASPFITYLVPAYRQCVVPNALHNPPLSDPSCNPPLQASAFLTVGTPDANGQGAKSIDAVKFAARPETPSNPADELIWVSLSDIRNKSDLSDYTGEVQMVANWRITDQNNGPSGTEPATVEDVPGPPPVTVPCGATADPTVGATCSIATTANSIVPGSIKAHMRMIGELGQIQIYDGGSDGLVSTVDNTLFMDEGIFVP